MVAPWEIGEPFRQFVTLYTRESKGIIFLNLIEKFVLSNTRTEIDRMVYDAVIHARILEAQRRFMSNSESETQVDSQTQTPLESFESPCKKRRNK